MIGYRFKSLDGFNCEVIRVSGQYVYIKSDCGKIGCGTTTEYNEKTLRLLYNNFGFINSSSYEEFEKIKKSKAWSVYALMIHRVNNNPSYNNVKIIEEWRCFNNFQKWYDENHIIGFAIDKDLLSNPDSKIYSPETCCFIPRVINDAIRADSERVYNNGYSYYYYQVRNYKREYLSFKSEEEAIESKRQYYSKLIREEAEKFRTKLDKRVYEKLISLYEK